MKKIMALAFALFFAVANAAETYEASKKITQQVLSGELSQTVYAGDEIKPIRILYNNIESGKDELIGFSELGLEVSWKLFPVCEISGKINRNIAPQTVKAYIIVQDDEGKFDKTEFTFEVLEKDFLFALDDASGAMNQSVKAGETIKSIVINYEKIIEWGVSGLPSGLIKNIDNKEHAIFISGTVDATVESGDYEYKVTVKDYNSEEHTLSGIISVEGLSDVTSIKVVENENQKVTAGDAIKPIAFEFANVSVTDNLDNFKFDQTLPASLSISVKGNVVTVSGTVDEKTKDGTYSIKVTAKGKVNEAFAEATVEVAHKPVVTSISVVENETQTVIAGESIKPVVFKFENMVDYEGEGISGFPGNYQIVPDNENKTLTVTGKIKENSKGTYTVKLSIKGLDNNASAEFTIDVTPVKLKFELVEGSDNQTVFAGKAITPIVYQYDHMLSAHGSGFPVGLTMERDEEKNQIKISGTVSSESAAHEYVYSIEVTDVYSEKTTVTGKINVVRESSSSSETSSSSIAASSSSEKSSSSTVQSSSSVAVSSSSVKSSDSKSSSSSVKLSSSSIVVASSSSAKSSDSKPSSSSAVLSSSSIVVASSSSVKSSDSKSSSSSVEQSSCSIVEASSSSVKSSDSKSSSSSVEQSSSSSEKKDKSSSSSSKNDKSSSSSAKSGKSSSSKKSDKIVAVAMNGVMFGYVNNELVVVQPLSSMVRVQVFDLTGHLVETFAEDVAGFKNFSLAHLNRGNYLVRVESNSMVRTARIAVK
ncbi:MAG: T9SS type A sorting domain-containing protein [Fibrobacter sp.]|nr:T9SS type A sorting domain-containing protein [Fibrobacter sp.]